MFRRFLALAVPLVAVLAAVSGASADPYPRVSVMWQPYGEGQEMWCEVVAYADTSSITCDPSVTRPKN